MKLLLLTLVLGILSNSMAQAPLIPTINDALEKYGFIEGQIFQENDTITYYLRNYTSKPKNLVVYIQGTDPNPLFSYKQENSETLFYRWFSDEYKTLDSTYTFAIIPKPGMEGIYKDDNITIPKKYYQNNYLDYRVAQVDLSIQHILQHHLSEPEKVIVYGHSEGATIAAPLALKNKSITHLGFWSGNVLNNFYEFSLFNRIESLNGQLSDSLAHENILSIMEWYTTVIENPESTGIDHFGFTNKRWASYERPPIEYLLELDIPIYAHFATEDESTPIETAYLLPIQFMQKRKTNLTFEVCIGCDHSYQKQIDDHKVNYWNQTFDSFMKWVETTK